MNTLYGNIRDVFLVTSPMVFFSLVILISFRVSYIYKNHTKIVIYREIMLFFFAFYVLSLFQIVTSTDDTTTFGSNFIPFREIMRYKLFSRLFIKNVIGNVLLFLPYGYFVGKYFAGKNKKLSLFLIALASVSIEITQFYIGRVFDVDDIILNLLGGILGYLFYYFSEKLFSKLPKAFKSELFLNIVFLILFIIFIVWLVLLLI